MKITSESYPKLFEALENISHDCGGRAGWPFYQVPGRWETCVPDANAALSKLSAEDLETFCIGDQDEAEKIAERAPELPMVHNMLNEFFFDWQHEQPARKR